MQSTNDSPVENAPKTLKQNGGLAILALFLILLNASKLTELLLSLAKDSNLVSRLWQPTHEMVYFIVPTFTFLCVIAVWIAAPKATQFKKIFKFLGVIAIVLYVIGLFFLVYAIGLGSGKN